MMHRNVVTGIFLLDVLVELALVELDHVIMEYTEEEKMVCLWSSKVEKSFVVSLSARMHRC
jgi:hypothetical protein